MSDVHDEHEDERQNQNEHEEPEYRGERLQRVMAQRGAGSRRKSEELITAGQVQVNGRVVTELGTRVDPMRDEIRVGGKVLRRQAPRYLMLNKPTGFITTVSDERDRWTVMDLVKVPERVYPVGRLDRATQGLVLMTNDGDLAHRIMHPSFRVEKDYLVFTAVRPSETQLQRLREGLRIDGHMVRPHEVRLFRESTEGVAILITIHEGLYHVVRRMMEMVGIDVDRLRRTRMGPLHTQGIPVGAWRDLTPGELIQLYRSVGLADVDAERANGQRPMQLTPTGGFSHLASTPSGPRGGSNRSSSGGAGRRGGGEERRGRTDRPPRRGEQRSDRPPRRGLAGSGPTRPQYGRDARSEERRGGDDQRSSGDRFERRDGPPRRFDREVRRDDDRGQRQDGPPRRQFDVKDPSRAIEDGFADRREDRPGAGRRDRGDGATRERPPFRRARGDSRDGERYQGRRPQGERRDDGPEQRHRHDGPPRRFEGTPGQGGGDGFERRDRHDGPPRDRGVAPSRRPEGERFERRDRDDRSERGPRRFEESDRQGHVRFQPRNSPAGRPRRDDRDGQRGSDNRYERRDRPSGPPRDRGDAPSRRPDGDDRRPTGERLDQRRGPQLGRPDGDRFDRRDRGDGPPRGRSGPVRSGGPRDAGTSNARGGNRDDRSRPPSGDRDRRPGRRR